MEKLSSNNNTLPTAKTSQSKIQAIDIASKNKKILKSKSKKDYQLELSDKSKELSKDFSRAKQSDSKVVSPNSDKANIQKDEVSKVVEQSVDKLNETKKLSNNKNKKIVFGPAVFFIGGSSIYDGNLFSNDMKDLTSAVDQARYFEHDQVDEMASLIKKRPKTSKVVLVGHGHGADSAIEVAQKLNTLDNKFREVDLLVTMNSIGFNNDFIPQNVNKNINYLTAHNGPFDDGPNIASDFKQTKVENYLMPVDHSDLDEYSDIQKRVIDEVAKLI